MSPTHNTLALRTLPRASVRKGTRLEVLHCVAGILTCLAVIFPAITFMAVNVFWHDADFGSVLGVATWQVVDYLLNGLFTVLGILVAKNMASLFTTTQRWLLTGRSGQISVAALGTPGYATAYILTRLRLHTPLILISIIVTLSPAFSVISVFLVDLKQTSHSFTFPDVSQNVTISLSRSNGNFSLATEEEWITLSTLVLFTTVASLLDKPLDPSKPNELLSCPLGFPCQNTNGNLSIIQYSGTVFSGNSTYGFATPPPAYWDTTTDATDYINAGVSPKLATATTLQVRRVAYTQSSDFVCQPIPFTNVSVPVGVPTMDDNWGPGQIPTLQQYGVFTDGPCFSRNSTFIIGDSDLLPYFDIQACHTDTELQLQFVVQSYSSSDVIVGRNASYNVEAYSCASTILEGLSTGIQTSPGIISVSPPGPGAAPVSNTTLGQYVSILNAYFGFVNPNNISIGSSRSQGEWSYVPRYNWGVNSLNFNDHQWEGATFLTAYANALVSGTGTFVTSSEAVGGGLAYSPETFDVIDKQVIQLGAPVAVGVPLLLFVVALLVAHLALLWLYKQELVALDTGDVMDMLLKVDIQEAEQPKLAELFVEESASDGPLFPWSSYSRMNRGDGSQKMKEVGKSDTDSDGSYGLIPSGHSSRSSVLVNY